MANRAELPENYASFFVPSSLKSLRKQISFCKLFLTNEDCTIDLLKYVDVLQLLRLNFL